MRQDIYKSGKDFILGFIFYKYLSERELDLFQKEKLSEDEIKKVDEKDVKYAKHVRETLGYFIAYNNLFSTWLAKGNDFDVKDVRDALSDFDQNCRSGRSTHSSLQWQLPYHQS